MRVALSVEALSPQLTGIGRYTWELAQRLAADDAIDDLRFYLGDDWIADPSLLLVDGPYRAQRARFRTPRWLKTRRFASEMRGRLFHGPNYFLPHFADGGVITVHDLSVFRFPETHPAARLKHFESAFAASLDRAAHVITDSETVRAELIAFAAVPPENVTAIPLGVSRAFRPHTAAELQPALAKYGLGPGGYALCVSTIEPRKKILELLRAWRQMPIDIATRTPLVIVGGIGWLSEEIGTMLAKGVEEGWVRYPGYVPEADLPALYAGASLFVYPSAYEGFGLPPIEAMASGVPTIVSNGSCLPEVTQGAAMTIDPDDSDAFAEALVKGLTDARWRAQAIEDGLRVAATYTWERCAAETRALYQYVATGRKAVAAIQEVA